MHVVRKQAIYDREGNVAFYEVFLQDKSTGKYPEGLDPLKAVSEVIDVLVEIGPQKVGNGKLVFIKVPAIFLEASMFDLLYPDYVGIDLAETSTLTDELSDNVDSLIKRGFKFCIDDFYFERLDYLHFFDKYHYVKIDIRNTRYNETELKEIISILKDFKKGAIAKNIETKEEYEKAYEIGFEYFQGAYLSKPTIVKDVRTVSYLKSTLIRIYDAIKSEDLKQLVEIIEKDVGVTYKLLKLLNSVYHQRIREFSNIEDAVVYLGIENVAKFLIVLALSEMFADKEEKSLWKKALFRASLGEKLAEVYAQELKTKAYLMGLFSISLDIFGQRPEELARSLALDEEIVQAYENRHTALGSILSLVELLEANKDEETLRKVGKLLEISSEKVKEILEEAKKEVEKFID